jgi:outer membrane immunogenic protein
LSLSQASVVAHLGYQQQFGWLVVGGEAGTFGAIGGQKFASVTSDGAAITGPCASGAGLKCQASVTPGALVGGKLGVDWGDWLVYAVGGGAFRSNIATHVSGIATDTGAPTGAHGWYAGAGFDYMLYKSKGFDVIAGVEYQHLKLDSVAECSVNNAGIVGGCPGVSAAAARIVSDADDAVWATLTLKFNPFGP